MRILVDKIDWDSDFVKHEISLSSKAGGEVKIVVPEREKAFELAEKIKELIDKYSLEKVEYGVENNCD